MVRSLDNWMQSVKNQQKLFWINFGIALVGLLLLGAVSFVTPNFISAHPGLTLVPILIGIMGMLGSARRVNKMLQQEIADLKSGDSTETQDSE